VPVEVGAARVARHALPRLLLLPAVDVSKVAGHGRKIEPATYRNYMKLKGSRRAGRRMEHKVKKVDKQKNN